MLTYTDWLAHLEHHKDLQREAEKERLVKAALSSLRNRKAEKKPKARQSEGSTPQAVLCCGTMIS